MSSELARQPVTPLAIGDDQLSFDAAQLAALRQLGVDKAEQGDLDVFFHVAKRSGLDPFAKQIYMIERKTKENNKWVSKWTIQTGIDGYRLNGHRAADRRGDAVTMDEPSWYDAQSGQWVDVWLDPDRPPAAARLTMHVNRADGRTERYTSTCHYAEYVQTRKLDSGAVVPNSMWKKMPANQIAKCTEAANWRKAYPDDFAAMVLEDAAQPGAVIDGEVVPEQRAPARASAAAILDAPADSVPTKQLQKLAILLDEAGVNDRDEKLRYLAEQFGREFTSSKDLTRDEVSGLIDFLESSGQPDETDQPTSDGAQA